MIAYQWRGEAHAQYGYNLGVYWHLSRYNGFRFYFGFWRFRFEIGAWREYR